MTEKVLSLGGVFLKARDPERLAAWYRDGLGIPADEFGRFGWVTDPEGNRVELWQSGGA